MKFPIRIFWPVFLWLLAMEGNAQLIPKVEIENGLIRAGIYLPDSVKGYYRATRFDWSGIMPYLEYQGHNYFGKWFKTYDPLVHESVMGPVEEFAQIGYEEAAVGQCFLKIGVGMLEKPKEDRYNKFNTYKIRDHGKWEIVEKTNQITFQHHLNSSKYSYTYVKDIILPKGKPELVLNHTFTNTGNKPIDTQVYNHNFFMIDSLKIGPGYVLNLPFEIQAEGRLKGLGEFAEIDKNEISFTEEIPDGNQVYIEEINGFDKDAKTYSFYIENKNARVGVKIQSDRPLAKLSLWSINKVICPEPFIKVNVRPGETFEWKTTYTFYTF